MRPPVGQRGRGLSLSSSPDWAAGTSVFEAVCRLGDGKDKLVHALNRLEECGYQIETNEVPDAIEAAWKKLDIEEMTAGIKPAA